MPCASSIELYHAASVRNVNIAKKQLEFYGSLEDLEAEHGCILTERDTPQILGVAILIAALFRPESA